MLTRIAPLVILSITIISCQREVIDTSQRPDNDELLVKTITAFGTGSFDTTIITYEYNASNRLQKETFLFNYTTPSGIQRLPTGSEYTRDGAGRITRIKRTGRLVSDPLNEITGFSNVYYVDNSSTKVDYISDDNNSFKTVFIYDAAGKISKTETFQHYPLPGDPLRMVVYYTHQYDANGNLITRTQFSDNDYNGVFEQVISYTFEFDGRINPVDRSDDALFEDRWSSSSPENCVRQTNKYSSAIPEDGFTVQFQYRGDNKPETAIRNDFGGLLTGPSVTTYYYQ